MSMLEQFLIRRAQETSNTFPHNIDTLDEHEFLLDTVAQKVCLSTSRIAHIFKDQLYFSRIFKKRIGLSPQKYCNSMKEQNEMKIQNINSLYLYDK